MSHNLRFFSFLKFLACNEHITHRKKSEVLYLFGNFDTQKKYNYGI